MKAKHGSMLVLLALTVQLGAQPIIFTQQINNNDNLMLIRENGAFMTLTDHPNKDSSPMVSPNGKMVVFTSERVGWWKIWTMDLESKEIKQLTRQSSAAYSPSWSPDSQKIAFVSTANGNQEILVMNRDGSEKTNITNTSEDELMPTWAKDGYIYYSSVVGDAYQAFQCKPDGTEKTQITFGKGDKLMPQPSLDLKQLLYYGNQDGNMEIYLFDLDSKQTLRLTNDPLIDMRPRWSLDGTRIVFERGNKGDNHHLFLMDADGDNVKQLTSDHYNYSPAFVPEAAQFD